MSRPAASTSSSSSTSNSGLPLGRRPPGGRAAETVWDAPRRRWEEPAAAVEAAREGASLATRDLGCVGEAAAAEEAEEEAAEVVVAAAAGREWCPRLPAPGRAAPRATREDSSAALIDGGGGGGGAVC